MQKTHHNTGSLTRTFARDIKSKLKIMSLKVDSCLPQMSGALLVDRLRVNNRIPGYMSTNASLAVNVNMSTNSGSTRGLYVVNPGLFFTDVLCVTLKKEELESETAIP